MSIVKLNNRAVKDATAVGSITGLGDLKFISRTTASSSSSLNITSGIDSTYKEYIFFLNNIHPADHVIFQFNLSIDGGSNYNVTKTTTLFNAYHYENDTSGAAFAYINNVDLAQSTSHQPLMAFGDLNNSNDGGFSGFIHLFDPSNTTFAKHFITRSNMVGGADGTQPYVNSDFVAGYANTTSAINAIQFAMSSGNIDSGTVDMYGVN
tara:strand:- start:21 stop:644 length:624 start_codon:yes stop_codon:yes gene_type:complete